MQANFPTLSSDRFILRQFVYSDLEDVFKGLSNPAVTAYYGVSYDTLEATKAQLTWFAELEKKNTGIWWAICSKTDGAFLGAGGLNDVSLENKKAEIGFWLLPSHWGKGIMSETMPLIFSHGFNTMGLHRIEGFVESKNANCKKAVAKLGFTHEGTMIDCEIKNGEFISLDIYAKFTKQHQIKSEINLL